ncbi:RELT-like protein 2 [Hypanus sabinus]|uniref:RELT-like protein 2 n=1 Tax=Hypanus sabinus TaxID=79690 RepID=UPI0028C3D95B|nr:RELT-like protein 2 [Hypanus sabinus]
MRGMENDGTEETLRPQNLYTIFLVILVFFVMGLLGILLCHVLQERGYRCRTSQGLGPEAEAGAPAEDVQGSHQDTVGQIVQCILDNKANAEALNKMLMEYEQMNALEHRSFCPEEFGGQSDAQRPHLHTVHSDTSGENRSVCLHCTQLMKPATMNAHSRLPGAKKRGPRVEVTVVSVGRFRVTHIERCRAVEEQAALPVDGLAIQPHSKETAEGISELLDGKRRVSGHSSPDPLPHATQTDRGR